MITVGKTTGLLNEEPEENLCLKDKKINLKMTGSRELKSSVIYFYPF